MNEENKTEHLKNNIYVNENQTVYISVEDVENLFDCTVYYDEKYNQIITTSDTKVANIAINEKKMTVNNSEVSILDSIIKIDNNIYLPISDMEIVYNVKVEYIESTNRIIIDELSKGMIRATITENTNIKFKPRGLSKNIGILKQGETVECFYTTSKGWRQIRTSDGTIGYIKANKLSNEYIIRQDMLEKGEAVKISLKDYRKNNFVVSDRKVIIKDIFSINEATVEKDDEFNTSDQENKAWFVVSNGSLNQQNEILRQILSDYKSRTTFIDSIVKKAIKNNTNGISIEFVGIEDKEIIKRFIVELAPKLREIGITTCVVLNENIQKQDYINIVDYIVE